MGVQPIIAASMLIYAQQKGWVTDLDKALKKLGLLTGVLTAAGVAGLGLTELSTRIMQMSGISSSASRIFGSVLGAAGAAATAVALKQYAAILDDVARIMVV
jgi:predicted naringenin-chalcone synthase